MVLSNDKELHQASFSARSGGYRAVGLNERLSFLRYDPGDYCKPHNDGNYLRNDPNDPRYGEVSMVTFQLYLNEGFEGE